MSIEAIKNVLNDHEHKYFKIQDERVRDVSLNFKFIYQDATERLRTYFPGIMP
jgi:hypothetical protein